MKEPATTQHAPEPSSLEGFPLGTFQVVVLSGPEFERLTLAERAVVGLAAAGLSNEQIARARKSATRTVANQLASAFRKVGVGSRFELAARLRGAAAAGE
ncbi:MAG: helix-turn-helix transcriptional regulator [Polyangiaceae bacterium]|nr:helix-turn-helix transcriptional regulator [Polyangiaceae bacterium]